MPKRINKNIYILSFITDIEILALKTEKLLLGLYTDLSMCDSWYTIKLSFDNCIRTLNNNLKDNKRND